MAIILIAKVWKGIREGHNYFQEFLTPFPIRIIAMEILAIVIIPAYSL